MKEKIKYTTRNSLILSQRNPTSLLSFSRKLFSDDNAKQILFNHKTSLETLLNMIKNSQIEYLSKKEIKSKNKNKTTKNMLISLKESLNLMLQEKNKKFNYMRNKNETCKKKIQNTLYPSSQELKINENKIKKDNKNIHSYILEKNQLVLLNFQMENEIEKTNFLIEQKTQINSYIRSIPFFFETNKEIFCNNKYEDLNAISKLLKEIIREVRKDFIEVVKEKMEKELEINGITIQINYIKDNIEDFRLNGCKKYIETEDIIQEESKEYTKSMITNQSKRNSFASINNRSIIKKMSGINSKNKLGLKKKERIIKDKLQNNNLFYTHKVNKDIFNGINNNNVNNYLNMNINVNINLNNKNNIYQESFNSSLDSKNMEENKDQNEHEQYEMDLNNNNKIIITPIITTENKNKLNTKNNSIYSESNNNEDSFVLDYDDN